MSVANLCVSALLGICVVALTVVGLNATREFNRWQQSDRLTAYTLDHRRATAAELQQLESNCVNLASIGVGLAEDLSEEDALNLFRRLEQFSQVCSQAGKDITLLTALNVQRNRQSFTPRILRRASLIADRDTSDPTVNFPRLVIGKGVNWNSPLEHGALRGTPDFDTTAVNYGLSGQTGFTEPYDPESGSRDLESVPTNDLELSSGFSSIENFIIQASIRQRNFRGRGQ